MTRHPLHELFSLLPLVIAIILFASTAHGQLAHGGPAKAIERAAGLPAYDVVSIKPNNTAGDNSGMNISQTTFSATNVSLANLIWLAYDADEDMVSGLTGPVSSAHFNIEAKILPSDDGKPKISPLQMQAMLIPLLADRFHLKVHLEPKTLPIYELVVVRGGPKFQVKPPGPPEQRNSTLNFNGTDNSMVVSAKSTTMEDFADELSDQVHRKVVDKTGLVGEADFTLKFTPELEASATDTNVLSIFTAVQEQLGLRLQPSKGPVDTLIIDHVEMPSAN
jgi:uncharacterized protein (TIGR03435 family)